MNSVIKEHIELKTMKPEMLAVSNMLSTEDFGVFVKTISGFFTNKINVISSLFSKTGDRANRTMEKEYNVFVKDLLAYKSVVPKIISNVNYSNVERIQLPVAMGIKRQLHDVTPILVNAIEEINNNLLDLIDTTDTTIANILGDKDYRTATRIIKIDIRFYKFNRILEDAIKDIIDPKDLTDVKPLYKIIGNISSINSIYNDLVGISVNNTFKHLKQLEDSIAQIASRTNFLYDYIKNDKEGKLETSKVVINRVSELLDLTADAVTSSVTILHLYNQVTAMTTNMLNELKKHA